MKKLLTILLLPLLGYGQFVFTKADNTSATVEANQDRISENVWLTRGNNGGALFNAYVESSYSSGNSPLYTEWALGTTTQISNGAELNFSSFNSFDGNAKNRPPVNQNLVLKLTNNTADTSDDAYYDIKFTSWSNGKKGGFSYTRSITPLLSISDQNNAIYVYPNPTTSVVTIEGTKPYDIEVYDLTGNRLLQLNGNSFDMVRFPTATYIVKITDTSNNEELIYKLIKN